jgi:hypothetical protein
MANTHKQELLKALVDAQRQSDAERVAEIKAELEQYE